MLVITMHSNLRGLLVLKWCSWGGLVGEIVPQRCFPFQTWSSFCASEACDANSIFLVMPMELIGLRLDDEGAVKKTGLDGFQLVFSEASLF